MHNFEMEKKIKLSFDHKPKRPETISVRLTEGAAKKLKRLAKKFEVSQADIIEKLIFLAEE
jgi:hypothetical protein